MSAIADRLLVLRDEVLDTAAAGDSDPPGSEIFDAIARALVVLGETDPGLDHTLHDAISRRLAWGEGEDLVLTDAETIYDRIVKAAQRSFDDPAEEMMVIEVAAEVTCAAARIVAMAALGRAGRERSAKLREELAQRRLQDALERQQRELSQLQRADSDW